MQMSDDGPPSKRLKPQQSVEFDLSALNDLPDALLSAQTAVQPVSVSQSTSYLTGLLTAGVSTSSNLSNGPTLQSNTSTYRTTSTTQPVAAATVFTSSQNQQFIHRATLPVSTNQPLIHRNNVLSPTNQQFVNMNGLPIATNQQVIQRPNMPTSANQQLPRRPSLPSASSHSLSTFQVNPAPAMGQNTSILTLNTSRPQPLVSTVRPQIQQPQSLQAQQIQRRTSLTSPNAPNAQASLSNDPSKQKLITQQLVLLLHAHKCPKKNLEPGQTQASGEDLCELQHCKTMKIALQHMTNCQAGRSCKESHCVSSRQIIAHWKNCTSTECPVCRPLRNVSQRNKQQQQQQQLQNGHSSTVNLGMIRQLANTNSMSTVAQGNNTNGSISAVTGGGSGPKVNLNNGTNSVVLNINGISPQQRHQLLIAQQQKAAASQPPPSFPSQSQVAGAELSQTYSIVNSQQSSLQQQSNIGVRLPGNVSSHGAPNAVTSQQPIDQDEMKKAYASLGLQYNPNNTPPSPLINQPLQTQGSNSPQVLIPKEWHKTVSAELRRHLVQKLVTAIFPSPDRHVLHDPRMNNLVNYAKKVENDMFSVANNRNEYYQKLAEKIYKIRRELEEKRKQRQQQEQQNQRAKALLTTSEDPMLVSTKPEPKFNRVEVKSEPMLQSPSSYGAGVSSPSPRNNTVQSFSLTKNLLQTPPVKLEKQEPKVEVKMEPKPSPSTPTGSAPPAAPTEDKKVVPTKVWKSEELRTALKPILLRMLQQEESIPFRIPVDPIALNIPDYYDIIKKPMDLSTIQDRLKNGLYKTPWDFVNDLWLMFNNAWTYNKKTSRVYKWCSKLVEAFEGEIDVVMKKLGYCCGRNYVFSPNVLVCYGKQSLACTIAIYQVYYAYENRYTFCDKCFAEIDTETVELIDELTGNPRTFRKDQFVKVKNDIHDPEPMTECRDCERKFHSICVQYMKEIYENGYLCDGCLKTRNQKRKENRYIAKRLPPCKLSTHIEERVNTYLTKKNIIGDGEVIIRILSYTEKETEVKQGMKERFPDMAPLIPYKCKALFAFQHCKQQAREVCFFSMHVQEYDANAPAPNTSRVYISYLDSIHFFSPREYRTAVYHEILIGYFDYVRILGYKWGHIWACPPSEGDDYIFHAHPVEQKVPKPKRLQEWYKKMLDKSIIEGVVQDYKDIYKDAIEKNMSSAAELPYFEGDFWTTILEDCVKECQEEEQKKSQEETMETDEADGADLTPDDVAASAIEAALTSDDTQPPGKHKKHKGNKTKNLKKGSAKKSSQPPGSDLSAKLFANIEKHRDMFFVLRLKNHPYTSSSDMTTAPAIVDPDPLISSDLMDARDSFLTMCREKHWEFSSMRRTTYSTMAFLHEIHTTGKDGFVYTCNACKAQVETRYHCSTCDDFDLCVPCHGKQGHEHKMEKLGLGIEGGEQGDSQLSPAETRKRSLQRCIDSLVHASQCKDANCKLAVCEKMKRVVTHTKMCKRKTTGGCPICKQLIALCCYHAKICKESMCPVPFCSNIKNKVKQQETARRAQQARLLQRRMANMNQAAGPRGVVQRHVSVTSNSPTAVLHRAIPATQTYTAASNMLVGGMQTAAGGYKNSNLQQQQQQQRVSPHLLQQPSPQQQQQHIMLCRGPIPGPLRGPIGGPRCGQLCGPYCVPQRVPFHGPPRVYSWVTNAPASLLQQGPRPSGLPPQNQSQQLMQQIQRQQHQQQQLQQQQQQMMNSVPQPIILNQGTQNVQVVHPLQHQPSSQQSSQLLQQPNQRVGPPQPLSGGASSSSGVSVSLAAREATRAKLSNLLSALRRGQSQSAEEKRQLLAIMKANPALLNMFLKKQGQVRAQQQVRQQAQAAGGGVSPHTIHPMNQGAQPSGGTSLMSRLQAPTANPNLAQSQHVALHLPGQLNPVQTNPNSQQQHQQEDENRTAQEELSRFVDSL